MTIFAQRNFLCSLDTIPASEDSRSEVHERMDTVMTKLQGCRLGHGTKSINAVAAYEDAPTDARVNEFCRTLVRNFGRNCEVTKQMWLLNELRMPQLRAIAANDAAVADIVIIAIHHSESLPAELKDWIETWLARKGKHPPVLLALLDPAHQGDSSSLRVYLEGVAKKERLELITQSDEGVVRDA